MLASLTPANVERWLLDLRQGALGRRCTDETISTWLSAIKTFSRKYIYRHLDMSRRDLLERVERYTALVRVKEGFSSKELGRVLTVAEDSDKYTDVRDRAMLAFYAASGLRFSEVLHLGVDAADRYTGWVKTVGKGDRERIVKLGERPLKELRAYLRVRRARDGVQALCTTDEGGPITYWGGQSIFRRLKRKTGLGGLHAHRFRHTWTQTALEKGAERAVVQDAMGWTSDQMVRRYGGWVRARKAAEAMPAYAPI